ncbi:nuclear transport factor 2 family protein, partial [Methylobacterium ajmalii]
MDAVVGKLERLSPADERVIGWLDRFEAALSARDAAGAAELFSETCFWRDLVAFTWNITTLEGRGAIRDMLAAQLGAAAPGSFTLEEPASEADGVTEAWIAFETATLRGRGYLRLKGEEAWTLLTAARELKGFEEPGGPRRERGVHHGVEPGRRSWSERR